MEKVKIRRKPRGKPIDPAIGKSTQWKPGQSGNPSGRPKQTKFDEALKQVLANEGADGQTGAESLAESVLRHAKKGNGRMAQLLAERTGGRPQQHLTIEGMIDAKVSLEEIDTKIAELLRRAADREPES